MKLFQRDTVAAYILWIYILASPLVILLVFHYHHSSKDKSNSHVAELQHALDAVTRQQRTLQTLVQEYYKLHLSVETGYGRKSSLAPEEEKRKDIQHERELLNKGLSWIENTVERLRKILIDQQMWKRLGKTTCSNSFLKDLLKEVELAKRLKQCEIRLADRVAEVGAEQSINAEMTKKLHQVEAECNATKSERIDVCCTNDEVTFRPISWIVCYLSGCAIFCLSMFAVVSRACKDGHHLFPSIQSGICRFGIKVKEKSNMCFNTKPVRKREHSLFAPSLQ